MPYKKILIAVDNSSCSLKAAKEGFALAHQLKATVGLVFAIDKGKEVVNGDLGITPEQGSTALLTEAEETITQLINMYDGADEVIRFMPEGFPKKEIVKIACDWEADLIVMGTHGRGGLQHLLVGSVAGSVIKHSLVPVMIVPSAK
jgi:nucleotide-binding universal stress UspA family protein